MDGHKLRIAVLFGGLSSECEVSLATGRYIYSLLDPDRFLGVPLYLDKKGNLWQLPDKLVIQNTTEDIEQRLEKDAYSLRFEEIYQGADLVFNALLGKYGEDGCIQGILELIGLPYTGSGILASGLGMDKKIHKKMLKGTGYKVAEDILVPREKCKVKSDIENWKLKIKNSLGFPCVVKPTGEGSSMGVSVVRSEAGLDVALEYAFKYDTEILIEEYLRGLEFTCVVWGNENPQAMLPTEIVFEGDFFTYEGKYMPGKTQTITPARLGGDVLKEIQRISVEVYDLLGCLGYGRVDGFVVPKGIILNESSLEPPSLQHQDPGSGSDNRGLTGSVRSSLSDLTLNQVDIYVTEPHTGTIMIPSSFVFQQASKFRITLDDKFTGKKFSASLTPRMMVTKIIELASEAHQKKKSLL